MVKFKVLMYAAIIALVQAHCTLALGQRALPRDSSGPTMHEFQKALYGFYHSSSIAALEAFHKFQRKPWSDDAAAFLDRWLRWQHRVGARISRDELEAEARVLLNDGCDDPLVHYAFATLKFDDHFAWEARRWLQSAIANLANAGYAPIWTARAIYVHGKLLEAHKHQSADEELSRAVDAYVMAINAGAFPSHAQRFLIRELQPLLDDDLSTELAKRLTESIIANPEIDEWSKEVLQGLLHIRLAWDARGKGWADDVTPEGWVGFERHLLAARDYLIAAHTMKPDRPEAAALMIITAMAGHAPQGQGERFWFDQAVAAQFDWPDAYRRYIYALYPRWGGSHEEMYAFGLECAATGRFDTDVPFNFMHALYDVAWDTGDCIRRGRCETVELKVAWQQQGVYEKAIEVIESTMRSPAPNRSPEYYISLMATCAWHAGRLEDCLQFVEQNKWTLDQDACGKLQALNDHILQDAALFGNPHRSAIAAAAAAFDMHDFASAATQYERLLNLAPDDVRVQRALKDRLMTASWMRDFAAGQWVPLKFLEGFPGWWPRSGAWQVVDENSVKGGPTRQGLVLACKAPFGGRLEIKGTFNTRSMKAPWSNVGVLFNATFMPDGFGGQSFIFEPRAKTVRVGLGFALPRYYPAITIESAKITSDMFHVRLWDGEAALEVNGQPAFAGKVDAGNYLCNGEYIALGGRYGATNGYAFFEDIQVRQLKDRPAVIDEWSKLVPAPKLARDEGAHE